LKNVEYSLPIIKSKHEIGTGSQLEIVDGNLYLTQIEGMNFTTSKEILLRMKNLIGNEPGIERELRKIAEKHIKSRMEIERLTGEIKEVKKEILN